MQTSEQTRQIEIFKLRAEESRASAEAIPDDDCRMTLLSIAASYDAVAQALEIASRHGPGRWEAGLSPF